ncbi:MAG: AraC family transcriptional regulator [Halioglobus sp.]|nr:AraC family transcriptional regulator [Halioglobus sp.]
METSILASAGRPLWRYLEAHNVDAAALFQGVGLDPELIHEPRSRYAYALLCKAWVAAAQVTNNDHVGLESVKHYTPLDLSALGITFLSSETLMEAFQRLVRFEAAVNSDLRFSVVACGERVELDSELAGVPEDAVRIVEDSRAAILLSLCRQGLGATLDPLDVGFTYPEPASLGDHFALFRCPVLFSQPVSRMTFNAADLKRPFTAANRELALSGDKILEEMISELQESDIISKIKRAIIDDLPSGTPGEEDIASRVFLSSRTLQRRLAEENTSFRAVLLEVRRELAQKYLADKDIPLAEISYMLGFSDTSSFSRAFKKWTGEPPAAFRSHLAA